MGKNEKPKGNISQKKPPPKYIKPLFKKKCKQMTFHRGPIVKNVEEELPIINDESKEELINIFKSSLIEKENKLIRDELFIGFNCVNRNIAKGSIVGIILNDPITTYVQWSLYQLAVDNLIPIIIVTDLDICLKETLKVSKLICIAFKEKVKNSDSILYQVFNSFDKIANEKDCNRRILNKKLIKESNKKDEHNKVVKTEILNSDKIKHFISRLNETIESKTEFNTRKTTEFIKLKTYFPNRWPDNYLDDFNIEIDFPQNKPQKKVKCENNQNDEVYKMPDIVKLSTSNKEI